MQVAGNTVPTVMGRVTGKVEKSALRPWVARLIIVGLCPKTAGPALNAATTANA